MLACSARCSVGIATFTTVPSMNVMLDASTVAARIHGPAFALAVGRDTASVQCRANSASQGDFSTLIPTAS